MIKNSYNATCANDRQRKGVFFSAQTWLVVSNSAKFFFWDATLTNIRWALWLNQYPDICFQIWLVLRTFRVLFENFEFFCPEAFCTTPSYPQIIHRLSTFNWNNQQTETVGDFSQHLRGLGVQLGGATLGSDPFPFFCRRNFQMIPLGYSGAGQPPPQVVTSLPMFSWSC